MCHVDGFVDVCADPPSESCEMEVMVNAEMIKGPCEELIRMAEEMWGESSESVSESDG